MSKELDALRELKYVHDTKCGEDKSVNEKFALIETTLEALQYIEEELRIDFITLFKALKQGNIWVREHNTEEKEIVYEMIRLNVLNRTLDFVEPREEIGRGRFLIDYGYSWALTKEELEKMNNKLTDTIY